MTADEILALPILQFGERVIDDAGRTLRIPVMPKLKVRWVEEGDPVIVYDARRIAWKAVDTDSGTFRMLA
jgi:hypothetical protein